MGHEDNQRLVKSLREGMMIVSIVLLGYVFVCCCFFFSLNKFPLQSLLEGKIIGDRMTSSVKGHPWKNGGKK